MSATDTTGVTGAEDATGVTSVEGATGVTSVAPMELKLANHAARPYTPS